MKKMCLKRIALVTFSLLLSATLAFSQLSVFADSTAGYTKSVTVDCNQTKNINADNWQIISGDTENGVSYDSSTKDGVVKNTTNDVYSIKFNNDSVRLGLRYNKIDGVEQSDTTQSWTGDKVIGRITPILPSNSKITTFNFDMSTTSEQAHRCTQVMYDYTDEEHYKALGFYNVGGRPKSGSKDVVLSVCYNQLYGMDSSHSGSKCAITSFNYDNYIYGASSYKNTKISYTYNDDTVTASVSFDYYKGDTYYDHFTIDLGEVTSPKVVITGGSDPSPNSTNTYGDYTNVSYTYDQYLDMTGDVEKFKTDNPIPNATDITIDNAENAIESANRAVAAYNELEDENLKQALSEYITDCNNVLVKSKVIKFKLEYPLPLLSDITSENAVQSGKEVNRATEAYAALTDDEFKQSLNDYISDCKKLAAKVKVFTEGYFYDDYSDEDYTTSFVNSVNCVGQPGSSVDNSTFNATQYTYNGETLGVSQPAGLSSVLGNKVNMVDFHKPITMATFKFFINNNDNQLHIHLNTGRFYVRVNKTDNGDGTYTINSVNYRILHTYNNWDYGTDKKNSGFYSYVDYTNAVNTTGWITMKYTINDSGYPQISLYNSDESDTPFAFSTLAKYDYSDQTAIGFSGKALTQAYIDDLKVYYGEKDYITCDTHEATNFNEGTTTYNGKFTCTTTKTTFTAPTLDGATIKVTDDSTKQDLRFNASFENALAIPKGFTPVEYGIIVMTNAKMPSNGILSIDGVSSNGYDVIVGSEKISDGNIPSTFNVELSGSGLANSVGVFDSTTLVGKRFCARAYVAYKDASDNIYYVYSNNNDESTQVENGQASKSVIGVAKSIASKQMDIGNIDNIGIKNIIDKTTATTPDERKDLLEFITANVGLLEQ